MTERRTAFGIDFGTTNTRVAYYNGEQLSLVPLVSQVGQRCHLPTLVSYRDGEAVAFGVEAREQKLGGSGRPPDQVAPGRRSPHRSGRREPCPG